MKKPVLAGVFISLALAGGALLVKHYPDAPAPLPRPIERRRLFLLNLQQDDDARARTLREEITKAGHRCDAVRSALMQDDGPIWSVLCAPGYSFEVRFDGLGEVSSVIRR